MFKQLSFLFFLLFLNQSFSQVDSSANHNSELQYGGRTGFYFTGFSYSYNYFSYFTLTTGIHEFSLGPSFGKQPRFSPENFSAEFVDKYKLSGIDFTYRIMPNGPGRVFDFYFQVDLFQKWGKAFGTDYMFNWPVFNENSVLDVNAKNISSQGYLEFGFDIKFLKYFYVGSAIGLGERMDKLTYDYGTYSEFSYKETNYETDIIFRANIGFRL